MTKLCFDYDPILYTAGSIGETRSVKVVHRASGDEYEFPNRTQFWGHHKKKAGGWLAEYNQGRTTPRLPDEFDVTDHQEPEDITHCMHTLKQIIASVKEATGAKSYYGYSGKGEVFRVGVSTVVKYKGNRDNALRPVHLDDLKDYLVKSHACKIVQGIEADDACSMDSYEAYLKWEQSKSDKDKLLLCAVDKDYLQCAAHLTHPHNNVGVVDSYGVGLGKLFLKPNAQGKNEVKGRGRLWLYQQVLDGDDSDNYFANSASAMKWGSMSAYQLLKDAKTDQEAFQALVGGYKTLYPQPKKVVGWRGDEIEVDWLSMLQENFTLAFMLRKPDDKVDVKKTMEKLGVKF